MRRYAWIPGLAALLSPLIGAAPAVAHPHAFIDVTVEVVFDSAGWVTALRETWLFDEFYTAFAHEGLPRNPDGEVVQAKLDGLTAENLKNLQEYSYFTRIEAAGKRVAVAKAAEPRTRMVDKRMEMSFTLPLAKPLAVGTALVTYAIYDPTYYIEMLHAESPDAIRLSGAPAGCGHKLVEPQPPTETVSLAKAMDRTQSAGDSLGANFAETVEIRCGR